VLHVVAETLRADAEIVSARSLKEARRVLAEGGIDLAVIDLTLADGDGLDLLSALHKADGEAIPAIVFSGHDAGPEVAGRVDAVLTKSRASLEQLPGILHQTIAAHRAPPTAAN
jgi:DNA-binding NtrC family response regulator